MINPRYYKKPMGLKLLQVLKDQLGDVADWSAYNKNILNDDVLEIATRIRHCEELIKDEGYASTKDAEGF